jgi:cytochrome c5
MARSGGPFSFCGAAFAPQVAANQYAAAQKANRAPVGLHFSSKERAMERASVSSYSLLIAALAAAVPLAAAESGERTGKEVEQQVCFRCHESAKSPAPKVGDKQAWIPRMSKGIDALVMSAIRGHGGMPPRGERADLTDNEIRAAILYMFNPSGVPVPAPKADGVLPAGVQAVTVDGIRIHLGLTSAERMRQYPPGSAEAKLHGGVPSGDGFQHVNVSLFDAGNEAPIANAQVTLEVEQVGMQTTTTSLEPQMLGGRVSYGAYVKMLPKGMYVLHVKVRTPGMGAAAEAKFRESPG